MVLVEDLKKEVKNYNWDVLVEGEAAERALDKARIWIKAKLIQVNALYDEEDPIIAEALLKRALYELYSFAENEDVAKDKKEDAIELLRARFGSGINADGYSQSAQNPLATGSIKNGRSRTKG